MGRIETEAFVTDARGPDAGWTTGKQMLALAVTLPGGRIVETHEELKVPVERWIVRGMTVPVSIDPDKPKKCDVILDRVPLLQERMAGRDWVLLNLEEVAARVRMIRYDIQQQLSGASLAPLGYDAQARAVEEQQALEEVARRQAQRPTSPVTDSEGRLRGMAHLISFEEEPMSGPHNRQRSQPRWKGKRLFRVWLYGYGPYALMDEVKFKRGAGDCFLAGGVPVSVDPQDLDDVRFLWEEWSYDPGAALQQQIARELTNQQAHLDVLVGGQLNAILAATPPEQRQMVAQQLRASGMPVPDELL